MRVGYKLIAEAYGPEELVRQARLAEAAGFDFVEMSDHYHPWLDQQGHSPFAWTVFGAIAAVTERIGLVSGVTCPTVRYHPAIIAQAAATTALLCQGRFTLGVGSGERLNEHVVGGGFGETAEVRHEMLREALAIIKLLWRGGYRSYRGRYFTVADARIFDLPDVPPDIAVAASGKESARIAAEYGDSLFVTEPKSSIMDAYRAAGGKGPGFAEVALAWGHDEQKAVRAAWDTSRWALTGWKVMSELPNPVNFAAATTTVRHEDIAEAFACGPDPTKAIAAARSYVEVGFDQLVLMDAGGDPDGFMDFYRRELDSEIRALAS